MDLVFCILDVIGLEGYVPLFGVLIKVYDQYKSNLRLLHRMPIHFNNNDVYIKEYADCIRTNGFVKSCQPV